MDSERVKGRKYSEIEKHLLLTEGKPSRLRQSSVFGSPGDCILIWVQSTVPEISQCVFHDRFLTSDEQVF